MSQIPSELKYTPSHEWIRIEDDGSVTVGITHHAQELLGDLVYVELPEMGHEIHSGDETGVVESVKAASDLYSPLNGEITAVNDALSESPELINQDPYGGGWIFKLQPNDAADLDELLDAEAYEAQVEAETEE